MVFSASATLRSLHCQLPSNTENTPRTDKRLCLTEIGVLSPKPLVFSHFWSEFWNPLTHKIKNRDIRTAITAVKYTRADRSLVHQLLAPSARLPAGLRKLRTARETELG